MTTKTPSKAARQFLMIVNNHIAFGNQQSAVQVIAAEIRYSGTRKITRWGLSAALVQAGVDYNAELETHNASIRQTLGMR